MISNHLSLVELVIFHQFQMKQIHHLNYILAPALTCKSPQNLVWTVKLDVLIQFVMTI